MTQPIIAIRSTPRIDATTMGRSGTPVPLFGRIGLREALPLREPAPAWGRDRDAKTLGRIPKTLSGLERVFGILPSVLASRSRPQAGAGSRKGKASRRPIRPKSGTGVPLLPIVVASILGVLLIAMIGWVIYL